jgi:Xaa-Pro aminopeptidase
MKYDRINKDLFIKNRANFISAMDPKSIAIFNSNDIYPISADSTMPFQQHRDIFHLSGVDQEESILMLFPDAHLEEHREMLFLKETSELIAIWEGEKLTKEAAFETAGIKNVFWLDQLNTVLKIVMAQADNIYINTNEHTRANTAVETREDRFIIRLKTDYPAHSFKKSAPIMHRLRSIKDPIEIALMQNACDITEKGVRRILGFIEPGVTEYEIEAELKWVCLYTDYCIWKKCLCFALY